MRSQNEYRQETDAVNCGLIEQHFTCCQMQQRSRRQSCAFAYSIIQFLKHVTFLYAKCIDIYLASALFN